MTINDLDSTSSSFTSAVYSIDSYSSSIYVDNSNEISVTLPCTLDGTTLSYSLVAYQDNSIPDWITFTSSNASISFDSTNVTAGSYQVAIQTEMYNNTFDQVITIEVLACTLDK